MRRSIVVAGVAAIAGLMLMHPAPLAAQDAPRTDSAVISPSHRAAARELLQLIGIDSVLRSGVETMLEAQMRAQPALEPFRDVLLEWARKYMTLEHVGPGLETVYAEEFTEAELRELGTFYQTPLGRKVAALTPTLTRRGALVGEAVAEANRAELEKMIHARATELQMVPPTNP